MRDEQIAVKYEQLLEEVFTKYKGRTFNYSLPVSSLDSDYILVGRTNFLLEFKDARGRTSSLSIDQFLDSMVELAENKILDLKPALKAKEQKERKKDYAQIIKLADHIPTK